MNYDVFTLFHSQNRISSKEGINHWIPFSESEVNAREKFESNFMYLFIKNKIKKRGHHQPIYITKTQSTLCL